MIELIYDCDITMGLPGADVDDGLALLYLLGCPEIRLLGVTSTFGNSSIEQVHACLLSILKDLGRDDIPAYRGASRPRTAVRPSQRGDPDSRAARFLAETVHANPGGVRILATGSTTNLLGACSLNPNFFREAKEIVFMGGVVEPLVVNGRGMRELNFSVDPEAALYALYAGHPGARTGDGEAAGNVCGRTVISANLCLQALLSKQRFTDFLEEIGNDTEGYVRFLERKILPWFSWMQEHYGLTGFHAWDATAALYITHPELFASREVLLRSSLDDLQSGLLRIAAERAEAGGAPAQAGGGTRTGANASSAGCINLPAKIRSLPEYWRRLFDGWEAAGAGRPG
jgi:purine nucleosidase